MLPSTLTTLFTTLLASFPANFASWLSRNEPSNRSLRFELRHLHAVSPDAQVLFHDVPASDRRLVAGHSSQSHILSTRRVNTFRPVSNEAFLGARSRSLLFGESEPLEWEQDEVIGPDVEKRETLLELAKMTKDRKSVV